MKTEHLHGALIGAGRVSEFHLKAWEQISQASIVALVDPILEIAHQRAAEFDIPRHNVFTSFLELMATEIELDFVDIATPPSTHLELVTLAAGQGLQITCQKPFTYTLGEAQQMIDICDAAGVVLNIHENWRWRTWYRELKERLDSGEIGVPNYARIFVHSDYWLRTDLEAKPYRNHGILMEWGIHHLDLLRYLFGEVESVYGRTKNVHSDLTEFDQKTLVILNFETGLTGYLDLSTASYAPYASVNRHGPMVEDLRIEGDQGSIVLMPETERGDQMRVVTRSKDQRRPAYTGEPLTVYQDSYTAAHQHFVDCLLSGEMPETHARDNLETLAVTLAAYHSSEINQVVKLDEFKRSAA